jgi:hypothetical protein
LEVSVLNLKLKLASLPVATITLILATIGLTGCGIGIMAGPSVEEPGSLSLPGMTGTAKGGSTPIAGSNITLWQTTNAGYPSATVKATSLATTTTDANGNFNFNSKSYTCAANSFVYITSTGGTVSGYGGSNPVVNNNLVEIAALGPCSDFPTTTTGGNPNVIVVINEVSTIAAAYALNGFMYVDDSGLSSGKENVYIGAPAANAAANGSCTGNGSAMTCVAAGLAHAFANAIALTDSVHYDGTLPAGNARTTLATNSLASIPQAEIHALANILGICTNTGGGSGSSGNGTTTTTGSDGSFCGNLFAAALSSSGTTPVDTLSAAINIAQNPTKNVTGLFNQLPTQPPFNPTLSARPADWALGITYSGLTVNGIATGFGFGPFNITAYSIAYSAGPPVVNTVTFTTTTQSLTAGQSVTISGFPTSTFLNGLTLTVLSTGLTTTSFTANINYPTAVSTTTESGTGTADSTGYPVYLALDANDNVYILSGNSNTSAGSTLSTVSAMSSAGNGLWANASTVDGTQGCYPGVIATDTNGNVWNSYAPSSGKSCTAAILERSASSGGAATLSMTSAAPYSIQGQASAIAFDRYNNLWYARDTSSGSNIMFRFPYAGAAGTYQNYAGNPSAVPAVAAVAYDMQLTGSSGTPTGTLANLFSIVIDKYANVFASTYSSSTTGLVFAVPNLTPTGTPSYTGQAASGVAATGSAAYVKQTLQTNHTGGIGFDASENIIASAGSGEFSLLAPTPSGVASGTAMIGLSSPTNVTVQTGTTTTTNPSTPWNGEVDANDTFWFPSFTASGQIWFTVNSTNGGTVTSGNLYTCYAPSGATSCTNLTYSGTPSTPAAPSTSTASPRMLQIDSTGSIWIAAEGAGNVVQILGAATPLWPQLSYGVFATKPQ